MNQVVPPGVGAHLRADIIEQAHAHVERSWGDRADDYWQARILSGWLKGPEWLDLGSGASATVLAVYGATGSPPIQRLTATDWYEEHLEASRQRLGHMLLDPTLEQVASMAPERTAMRWVQKTTGQEALSLPGIDYQQHDFTVHRADWDGRFQTVTALGAIGCLSDEAAYFNAVRLAAGYVASGGALILSQTYSPKRDLNNLPPEFSAASSLYYPKSVTARLNADGVADAMRQAGLTVVEISRWLDMDEATLARGTTEYSVVVGVKI